jgi:hypothetical protein
MSILNKTTIKFRHINAEENRTFHAVQNQAIARAIYGTKIEPKNE